MVEVTSVDLLKFLHSLYKSEFLLINDLLLSTLLSGLVIIIAHHIVLHCLASLLSLGVELAFYLVQLLLRDIAGVGELLDLNLMLPQVVSVGHNLVFKRFAIRESLILQECTLSVNWFALILSQLFYAQLLKLLLWVVFVVLAC